MRKIHLFSLALLFLSLFFDWGGFGSSFISRMIFGTPNFTDSSYERTSLVFVVFVFVSLIFLSVKSRHSKYFSKIGAKLASILAIFILFLAYFVYSFQNFPAGGNVYRLSEIGIGMPLAIIALMILSFTFYSISRKQTNHKNGKNFNAWRY